MAAVGPGHRLYGTVAVTREELRQERFICNYTEVDRNFLERMYGEDSDLDVMLESDEPMVVRRVVSSGLGVSFYPVRLIMRQLAEGQSGNGIWFIRILDYTLDTPTCITKKKNRFLTQAANDFFNYAISYCGEESRQVADFLQQFMRAQKEQEPFDRYRI